MRLRATMIEENRWSPYLEVGLGPDAEIFTKASPLSTVGTGMPVGIRRDSDWNNPEPEVVLICAPDGRIVGATLGNDVNLRDWEGRSALLLGRAKDNRSSASIGPFIRLFDSHRGGPIRSRRDPKRRRHARSQRARRRVLARGLEFDREDQPRPPRISLLNSSTRTTGRTAWLSISGPCSHPPPTGREPMDRWSPAMDSPTASATGYASSSPLLGGLVNEVRLCESCPRWTERISDLVALT